MKHLKTIFACLLMAVLSIGQVWADEGDVVVAINPCTIAGSSTSYNTYSNANWAVNVCNNSAFGVNTTASNGAKQKLSNNSAVSDRNTAIASALAAYTEAEFTVNTQYVAALIGLSDLANVGKFGVTYGGTNGGKPDDVWVLASTNSGTSYSVVGHSNSISSGLEIEFATIASAQYAVVFQRSAQFGLKSTPVLTFYEGATAGGATLVSIAISGTPTKTDYVAGEEFDATGLVAMGTYSDDSEVNISSSVEWSYTPAGALTQGLTSVNVTATKGEIASAATPIAITVASAPVIVSSVEGIEDGGTYYIKGVRSSGSIVEYLTFTDGTAGASISGGSASSTEDAVAITFNKVSDGVYQLVTPQGLYVQPGTSNGKIALSTSAATCTLTNTTKSYNSSATIAISIVDANSNTWIIQKNTSGTNFGGYKNSGYDVTLIPATAPAVNKPTISGDENFLTSTTVTLSCTTDGATIYYTTDGSDPKSSATTGTSFTLTNSATVRAIAKKGDDWSAEATKSFTKATVLTPAEALAIINGWSSNKTSTEDYYVAGIISQIDEVNENSFATYYISADGTTTDQLQVYKGLWVNGANFTSTDQIQLGDEVTVKGKLKKYNSYKELDQNNKVVLYLLKARLSWSGALVNNEFAASLEGANTFPTLVNSNSVTVEYSSSNTDAATINASTGAITLKAVGSTTITANFTGNPSFKANSVSYTLNVSSSVIKADISFECNGATSCPETMLAQSNLPSPLPTVIKAGKNFGGWFTDSEFNTPAVAGAAVASTDPITLYAKWLEPYNIAAAKAVIDANTSGIANQYVAGKISQIDSYNSTYHSITYWISDDGTTTDQIQVYSGLIGNAATPLGKEAFDAKENLELGDEVVVFGTLKLHNSDVYEFDKNNTIYSFNRPAKPTITADPAEVTNVVAEGVTNQTIALTYENIENYLVEVTLHDDAEGTEAFSDTWLTASVSDADNYATITYSVAANEGAARTAYMKVYATGDDDKEATKIIAVSQEAYVAPAAPAELPFAFDGGRADIASTQGMSQDGLDSDYGSSPKLKFNTTGDYVIINIASDPGKLTYDIIGNGFSGGTFKVQESVNGVDYTDVATYTELGAKASEEQTLLQATRFVKFIYTEKVSGNVALGNIAIAAYVAPAAVETPAFSPAGGEYAGAQSVTISCETGGATIYYTTDGTDPDNTSDEYTDAINVDESKTIKAIAYKGDDHSEIASATYTITAPLTDYYEKVTSGSVAEGTYLIVYEAGNVAFNGGLETLDASSNTIAVEITNDHKIGVTPATAAATFYIDPTAGTIKSASGKYIGRTANTNGLNESATEAYTNTLSIDGDGNAVIVGSGSTATYLRYNPSSGQTRFRYFTQNQQMIALYKLANEVIKPASGLAWDPADDIEITVGDAFTAPTLLNPNSIAAEDITIESSNTDLATVTAGVVELVENATGTTTITATYTGETYKPATVSYKIKVNPASSIVVSPSLYVNFGSVEVGEAVPGNETVTVTLTNVANATAALGGANPGAFSIDKEALTASGDITISILANTDAAATYSATLTISDDATENPADSKVINLSFEVTEPVVEETPVSTTSKWVLATEITDGMQVLIVGERNEKIYAVGAQTSNNRTAVEGSLSEGVFTPGENTMAFTVVAQEGGTYALQASNGKYLYAAGSGSGKNFLRSQDEVDDNAKWTLSVSSATANGTNTNNKLQLNNSSDIFSCYSSTQKAIQFYVPKPAPAPEYETVRSGLEINRYYTVCLPKKVTAIKGASFWTLHNKSQDGATAYLEEETNNLPFAAGTPFIIQATAANLEVVYEGAATEDAGTNGALHGTLVYMDAAALAAAGSDIYMLFSNELRPVGDDNHLDANRAYVKLNELDAVAEAPQSAPGKRVRAMPMQPQVVTDIDAINASEKPMKMMINGQIFILRGEKMYDTTGRLMK